MASNGEQERQHQQRGNGRLGQRTGLLDDAEAEDANNCKEDVLSIVDRPLVVAEGAQRVLGVEAGL